MTATRTTVETKQSALRERARKAFSGLEAQIHTAICGWWHTGDDTGCDCPFKDDIKAIHAALAAEADKDKGEERNDA